MSTKTGAGLHGISVVCVPTPMEAQERAIAFYESLGFEKRADVLMGGVYRWVEVYLPEGSTGIALTPPPPVGGAIRPALTGITLTTSDIDATHAAMRAAGADVDAEVSRMGDPVPPLLWFRDPNGHTLTVVEQP